MTDKQIKEEIKHINTRNQEYIAENNKMTKKIIDGVDVSGCIFFEIHYLEDEDVKIKEFCRIIHCDCDSNPNCYYKQLQRGNLFSRKEQEYERLSSLIRETQTYSDVCCVCRDEILIYPSISGRRDYSQIEVEERSLKKIIQQFNQLKAENEELKKKIKYMEEYIKTVENSRNEFEKESKFLKEEIQKL